jgi:hypothetical protein
VNDRSPRFRICASEVDRSRNKAVPKWDGQRNARGLIQRRAIGLPKDNSVRQTHAALFDEFTQTQKSPGNA